ncbi:MAG TPA: GIY-YIG nuclease family protein [Gammaproteobacteria bacterium]|nr:GIY-YIG nuclease family protein [Gammaproteobacteria bacterium]
MTKQFAVYMLASARNGTLYIGVTSDLVKRIWQHKEKVLEGFTADHDVSRLVYFEMHRDAEAAIQREKQIKKWKRDWKLRLIEENNPQWEDLYEDITGGWCGDDGIR